MNRGPSTAADRGQCGRKSGDPINIQQDVRMRQSGLCGGLVIGAEHRFSRRSAWTHEVILSMWWRWPRAPENIGPERSGSASRPVAWQGGDDCGDSIKPVCRRYAGVPRTHQSFRHSAEPLCKHHGCEPICGSAVRERPARGAARGHCRRPMGATHAGCPGRNIR